MPKQFYFDHNATSPTLSVAMESWVFAQSDAWQNPSSPYRSGARVHALVEKACERLAQSINCDADEVVFTSGATEGINAFFAWVSKQFPLRRVLISKGEHASVYNTANAYFQGKVDYIDYEDDGSINLWKLEKKIGGRKYAAVVVMAANHETGMTYPWEDIQRICKKYQTWYLCDASQWMGKLPVKDIGTCDFVASSAHKFGGNKGVGFLKVPKSIDNFSFIFGGDQQDGRRSGTIDYPGIASMIEALEWTNKLTDKHNDHDFRPDFMNALSTYIPEVKAHNDFNFSLWNTISLLLPKYDNVRWILALDNAGFQVSMGSACALGVDSFKALQALNVSSEEIQRTIRISSGWETKREDWIALADEIANIWRKFQEQKSLD